MGLARPASQRKIPVVRPEPRLLSADEAVEVLVRHYRARITNKKLPRSVYVRVHPNDNDTIQKKLQEVLPHIRLELPERTPTTLEDLEHAGIVPL